MKIAFDGKRAIQNFTGLGNYSRLLIELMYQNASQHDYFLFAPQPNPSRYEGFGIPILEALNSGTPVIAATGSCLEEAGGPHSLYVHPDDSEALAQRINRVMTNSSLRQEMIIQGKLWAQKFSIQNQYTNILKVYESL